MVSALLDQLDLLITGWMSKLGICRPSWGVYEVKTVFWDIEMTKLAKDLEHFALDGPSVKVVQRRWHFTLSANGAGADFSLVLL